MGPTPTNDADKKFWCEFFLLYKDLPVLWNPSAEGYNNKVEKASAYQVLVDKLKENDPEANRDRVYSKINLFRTKYRHERNRELKCKGKYRSHLWYYNYLSFLKEIEKVPNSASKQSIPPLKVNRTRVTRSGNGMETMNGPIVETEDKANLLPPQQPEPAAYNIQIIKSEHLTDGDEPNVEFVHDSMEDQPSQLLVAAPAENEALARVWACQYNELPEGQKLYARKMISDIFYYGSSGALNATVVGQLDVSLRHE